jgi:predicted ATPase/DNA-binding SARP family transcriptional activator/DNA-binding CsgD family transcriptional regulator
VRIALLGGFRVSVDKWEIGHDRWRLRKAVGLVKLLALAPGHRLHRDRALEMLWPGLDPRAAANNLHYALYVARQTLDPASEAAGGYLRLRDNHLELCPESPLWIDVETFEEAAAAARRTGEPAAYRAALDLYAGDLLPEDRYEEWTEDRREELRRLRLALLIELARLYEARGELGRAIETFERVVTDEPVREEAHAGLMRLHAAAGQHFGAVLQYERLTKALRQELGREPDAASRRLYRQIMAGESPEARPETAGPVPPERSETPRHNLPAAVSSFVGREKELVEIKRLLTMTRLLTLMGTGGAGKTRLSLEVARDLAPTYPDGAWFAELASLSDPKLLPQAVAAALGIREEPGRPLVSTLADALRTRDLLLVLDNCEHLVEACARLADEILSASPGVRILATSREALGITGEVCWPVRPLSVPAADHRYERLAGYESVRLFVERTRARLPGFELTSANSQAVAEVCRKLEGIPLAIELATARTTVLAVEQVADRLADSLGLLSGDSRTADPRHRTLRAALDWSFDPLSEPERKLFGRLSVFAGGWTFEAAETVGAGDGIEEGEVLDLLGKLVNKSLVVVRPGGPGVVRYGMLEPVRQYAREKLDRAGEAEEARRRHTDFFLDLAERAEPELMGPRPAPWLGRLAEEHDNIRAALSWALGPAAAEDRTEVGLRTAAALERFWLVHGPSEGRGWLERGLAKGGASPDVRARALGQAGWIALFQGSQDRAIAMLEESLVLFKELGDRAGMATSLTNLGFAVAHSGDSRRVAAMREEAEALRREPLEKHTLAHLLHFLAMAALDAGDLEQALALPAQSLRLHRELEDIRGTAMSLTALGMITLEADETERAEGFFVEGLKLLRRMGEKMGIAYCLLGLAGVAGEQARPERAARLWGAAEALRENIGMDLSPFDRTHSRYEERLASARSVMDEESWEAAWAEGRAMSPEAAIEHALSGEDPVVVPRSSPVFSPDVLTPREREVAEQVARGLTNRQLATALSISERTVHTHVGRILRKLGLGSRAQITAWVIETRSSRNNR